MPGSLALLLRLGQPQPAVPAREERRGDLGEVALHRVEGLGEAAVDRLGQLVAQRAQLVERRARGPRAACAAPTRRSFSAAYSSFANGLTPPSCSRRRSSRSSFSASSSRPPSAGSAPAASSRRCASSRSASKPGDLDVDARDPLRRLRVLAAQLDLAAAERAQLARRARQRGRRRCRPRRASAPASRSTAREHRRDATRAASRRRRRAPDRRAAARPGGLRRSARPPPPAAACAEPPARAARPRPCRR